MGRGGRKVLRRRGASSSYQYEYDRSIARPTLAILARQWARHPSAARPLTIYVFGFWSGREARVRLLAMIA